MDKLLAASDDCQRVEAYDLLISNQQETIAAEQVECESMGQVVRLLCSDSKSENIDLAIRALKCLGFYLHHRIYLKNLSDDETGMVLRELCNIVTTTKEKIRCNLSIWCISVQELSADVLSAHAETLFRTAVHGLNNPMKSLAVTFEAIQALKTLQLVIPSKARDFSHLWAPPVYQRLVSSDKRERELASNAISELQPSLVPLSQDLFKVVEVDISQSLVSKMKTLAGAGHGIAAMNAWKYYVLMLGDHLYRNSSIVNAMLKVPELTFISKDAAVRISSLSAWEAFIDALISSAKPKHVKLLLMPIVSGTGFEQDPSVKRQLVSTWRHLLKRLDAQLQHTEIFDVAVLTMVEPVVQVGPLKDPFIWQNVMVTVEALAVAGCSVPLDFSKVEYRGNCGGNPDGNYELERGNDCCWKCWNLNQLDAFLRVVKLLWDCGMKDFEGDHSAVAAVRIWYVLVTAVYHRQRDVVTPSVEHVTAVHSLLKFVSGVYELDPTRVSEAWKLTSILVDGLGSRVLTSTFYKIGRPWGDDDQQQVLPGIFLMFSWAKVASFNPSDVVDDVVLEGFQRLLHASKIRLDNNCGLLELMNSFDWLHTSSKCSSKLKLLTLWMNVSDDFLKRLEDTETNLWHSAVVTVLLFPVMVSSRGDRLDNCFNESWIRLHDAACRVSSLQNEQPNQFSKEFYGRIGIAVDNLTEEVLELLVPAVVNALNQAQLSNVSDCALSKRRRRFISEDDASNVKQMLMVAARLLNKCGRENAPECSDKLFAALESFARRVSLRQDALLIFQTLSWPLVSWLNIGLGTSTMVQRLHKLVEAVLSALQTSRPALQFNSKLLETQASFLASAFSHSYGPIPNTALQFWQATYGNSKGSQLQYPRVLVPVLRRLSERVTIDLPGLDISPTPPYIANKRKLADISPTSVLSPSTKSSPVVEPISSGKKKRFADLIELKKSPENELKKSQEEAKRSPRKKIRFMPDSAEDFVVIPSKLQVGNPPRSLTERQKEVRALQRKEGPGVRTYTSVDFSQGDALFGSEGMDAELTLAPEKTNRNVIVEALAVDFSAPCALELVSEPKNEDRDAEAKPEKVMEITNDDAVMEITNDDAVSGETSMKYLAMLAKCSRLNDLSQQELGEARKLVEIIRHKLDM